MDVAGDTGAWVSALSDSGFATGFAVQHEGLALITLKKSRYVLSRTLG